MSNEVAATDVSGLIEELESIRSAMADFEKEREAIFSKLEEFRQKSARNLLHYLAFRQFDVRHIQGRLARYGLSSLGRTEAHVLASINAVLEMLSLIKTSKLPDLFFCEALDFAQGAQFLRTNTDALLGPCPARRNTRIMVTMPSEAATDPSVVDGLLMSGMDCMRINCAHDDEDAWAHMIENLRLAERSRRRSCRLLMDLAGPKLRTGPIAGTSVLKCRPERDYLGHVVAPVRVAFIPLGSRPCLKGGQMIPVPADWLSKLAIGDHVVFTDSRGARRSLTVKSEQENCRWLESHRTFYMTEGTVLEHHPQKTSGAAATCQAGAIKGTPPSILLHEGDTLILSASAVPGTPATHDAFRKVLNPATIGCTLPEAISQAVAGEHIWLDDGKIGAVIKTAEKDRLTLEVTGLGAKNEKLLADKGINFPSSNLNIPALTEKDLQDLKFVARNTNIIGLSFVNSAEDVSSLQRHLSDLNAMHLGVILKIETRRAFERLPDILIEAMPFSSTGVMIARGDLAIECGFERMAEVQEEILWISEAAHIPVIWATQVLETLAKTGIPTRAEITDAAMAVRAECVMLNKGSHIEDAMTALDDILRRMEGHQSKKVSLLRPLRSWRNASKAGQ